MNRFLRKIFLFLKFGGSLIAGGLYVWVITILLEDGNWLGISALTTMLLAIAAFWAIWQNYRFREKDRKERLLNEIIEWAEDVAKCGIARPTPELEVKNVRDDVAFSFLTNQYNKLDTLQLVKAREYTKEITQKIDSSLQEAVDEATKNLKKQINCLRKFKTGGGKWIIKEVIKNNNLLYNSAVKVIQEATRTKTEDIH